MIITIVQTLIRENSFITSKSEVLRPKGEDPFMGGIGTPDTMKDMMAHQEIGIITDLVQSRS